MVNFYSISCPHASPVSGVTVGQQRIGYPEVIMAVVEQLLRLTLKFSHLPGQPASTGHECRAIGLGHMSSKYGLGTLGCVKSKLFPSFACFTPSLMSVQLSFPEAK